MSKLTCTKPAPSTWASDSLIACSIPSRSTSLMVNTVAFRSWRRSRSASSSERTPTSATLLGSTDGNGMPGASKSGPPSPMAAARTIPCSSPAGSDRRARPPRGRRPHQTRARDHRASPGRRSGRRRARWAVASLPSRRPRGRRPVGRRRGSRAGTGCARRRPRRPRRPPSGRCRGRRTRGPTTGFVPPVRRTGSRTAPCRRRACRPPDRGPHRSPRPPWPFLQFPRRANYCRVTPALNHGTIIVLLADDDRRYAAALRLLIEEQPELTVVALAYDGHETLDLAEQLEPDAVVVDLHMPNMDGVTAIRKLREEHPHICLIALTGDESTAMHDRAT